MPDIRFTDQGATYYADSDEPQISVSGKSAAAVLAEWARQYEDWSASLRGDGSGNDELQS